MNMLNTCCHSLLTLLLLCAAGAHGAAEDLPRAKAWGGGITCLTCGPVPWGRLKSHQRRGFERSGHTTVPWCSGCKASTHVCPSCQRRLHKSSYGDNPSCGDCVRLQGRDLTCADCGTRLPWSECPAGMRRAVIAGKSVRCLDCYRNSNATKYRCSSCSRILPRSSYSPDQRERLKPTCTVCVRLQGQEVTCRCGSRVPWGRCGRNTEKASFHLRGRLDKCHHCDPSSRVCAGCGNRLEKPRFTPAQWDRPDRRCGDCLRPAGYDGFMAQFQRQPGARPPRAQGEPSLYAGTCTEAAPSVFSESPNPAPEGQEQKFDPEGEGEWQEEGS